MERNEVIKILKNAIIESEKIIEELKQVKEIAERKKRVGGYYSHIENCEKEIVEIAKSKEKSICDDFINKIVLPSYGMKCDNRCIECRTLVDIWLSKEYIKKNLDPEFSSRITVIG